jgi:hypothetical protein
MALSLGWNWSEVFTLCIYLFIFMMVVLFGRHKEISLFTKNASEHIPYSISQPIFFNLNRRKIFEREKN